MAQTFATTEPQAAGFEYTGQDYGTFLPDGTSDLTFDVIADPRQVVAQHVLRRWILEQGQLDVPWVGAGVQRYLNATLSQATLNQLTADLRKQALDVDGVTAIVLTPSQTALGGGGVELAVAATITMQTKTGDQTFDTVFVLTPETAIAIVVGLVT
jgi:hypothetical protein